MALSNLFDSLSRAGGDLCSLSVETYTGKITAEIKGADGKGIIDWDKLVNEAQKDADGVVHLKLASKFNIDGDATLFIAEGEIPSDLRAAHDSAVEAGQTVRGDLMDLLGESIKKLV